MIIDKFEICGLVLQSNIAGFVRARSREEVLEEFSYRLGWLGCRGSSVERDVNGMLWERITADQQAAEIR
jgi:hypothetical protein